MATKDETIEELTSLILMQYNEIEKLKEQINRIKQYISIYEEYIERGDR